MSTTERETDNFRTALRTLYDAKDWEAWQATKAVFADFLMETGQWPEARIALATWRRPLWNYKGVAGKERNLKAHKENNFWDIIPAYGVYDLTRIEKGFTKGSQYPILNFRPYRIAIIGGVKGSTRYHAKKWMLVCTNRSIEGPFEAWNGLLSILPPLPGEPGQP